MKTLTFVCLIALLMPGALLQKDQKKGTPQAQKTEYEQPKAPAPSPEARELGQAYGSTKQYCCQLRNGCISGPIDGSAACKRLHGKPFKDSYCAQRTCVDP